jgi:DMSO/TMAO reductase YedYZ molybdopterin-dependent catalytic subunit
VGFYERNRQQLVELGYDPARLPPGQYLTQRFPVLHIGTVPDYADLTSWSLRVSGAVRRPLTLGWDELTSLPAVSVTVDLHCVTKWSKLDTAWHGVRVSDLLVEAGVEAGASHVLAHGEGGYTQTSPCRRCRVTMPSWPTATKASRSRRSTAIRPASSFPGSICGSR